MAAGRLAVSRRETSHLERVCSQCPVAGPGWVMGKAEPRLVVLRHLKLASPDLSKGLELEHTLANGGVEWEGIVRKRFSAGGCCLWPHAQERVCSELGRM